MTREIKLTQGRVALVDDEDFEWLTELEWHLQSRGYAATHTRGVDGKIILMHRMIMKTPSGMETDHINHNKLDNRKENLRICSRSQNMQNRISVKNCGFKGVVYHKGNKSWYAQICINHKRISLGYFKSPEDAAQAYDASARENFGGFANTNFQQEA